MALGFVMQAPFDTWDEARFIFLLEALAMLPFVVFIMLKGYLFAAAGTGMKEAQPSHDLELPSRSAAESSSKASHSESSEVQTGSGPPAASAQTAPLPWWRQVGIVLQSRTYCLVLLGYSASIFSLGGFAFWVPAYCEEVLKIEKQEAGLMLGAISATAGIIGTIAGGLLLDYQTTREIEAHGGCTAPSADDELGVRGRLSVRLAYRCSILATPFVLISIAATRPWLFYAGLTVGQLFVFMSTAPVNVAMMEAMPPRLRGLAMGICTTATHCLGDVISPVLIGKVKDWCGGNLSAGVWMLGLWPLWSVFYWGIAAGDIKKESLKRLSLRRSQPR
jgi:hypothetical protein